MAYLSNQLSCPIRVELTKSRNIYVYVNVRI